MTDPYLIAHVVRGEPAFDIAEKMDCPHCGNPTEPLNADWEHQNDCHECEAAGYWWIIPTSGHRARPYWSSPLVGYCNVNNEHNATLLSMAWKAAGDIGYLKFIDGPNGECPTKPEGWPDHYAANDRFAFNSEYEVKETKVKGNELLITLGLKKPVEIKRRV